MRFDWSWRVLPHRGEKAEGGHVQRSSQGPPSDGTSCPVRVLHIYGRHWHIAMARTRRRGRAGTRTTTTVDASNGTDGEKRGLFYREKGRRALWDVTWI